MDTVLIAGGTGLVGSRLYANLVSKGYTVLVLTRNKDKAKAGAHMLYWDIERGIIDEQAATVDYVINLSGAGIADGRWTRSRKQLILNSRIDSTGFLIEYLRKREVKLKAFLSASAIGYYGDGGNKVLREEDDVVTDEFLSQVCVAWEDAAANAQDISKRLITYRISTVLSREGGALAKMDVTIPLGVANYLGSGDQYFSWIHIDDLCDMFIEGIKNMEMNGIYNACAPEQLTNKDFTRELRDAINKKALLLPAPAFGIKLAFGEMARVVLNSSRVSADKILDTGFQFEYRTAELALADLYS